MQQPNINVQQGQPPIVVGPRDSVPSNGMTQFSSPYHNMSQITQANIITEPIRPPGVVHRLTFSSENIKRLTGEDFNINSKEIVTLKYDDCILVLFHGENTESYQIANIWALVAQQVAGPIFAGINLMNERRVAEAFMRLKSDGSNPLHWAALRQLPFILVYRKGWPVAVYNGPREVQAIIDYSLTLACEAGYYEIQQLGGSMQGEARLEMGPYDVYTNIPGQPPKIRKESLQYSAGEPIRGFNPNIPIAITGSTGARTSTNIIRSEERQQQQSATEGLQTSLTQKEERNPALERITGEPVRTMAPRLPNVPQPPSAIQRPNVPQPSLATRPFSPQIAVPANIRTTTQRR
jgi:hypothetical protein